MYILFTILHVSYFSDWENLFKHKDISSLVIISIILMICRFDQEVVLLGEIRCWSLLGLTWIDTKRIKLIDIEI